MILFVKWLWRRSVLALWRKTKAINCKNRKWRTIYPQADNCEEWLVQKYTPEKKTVTKTTPETSCEKYPRKVCATSNCVFVKSEKTCREETRSLVQNIPSEDCDLEPRETCKLETVLVPRLVEKPNCVQVPKEICVDIKANPRKVTKPVIKEWCYRPSDFATASTKEALDLVIKQLWGKRCIVES